MGRGRAKAKQTKVARELKYSSAPTDFKNLQRELGGSELSGSPADLPRSPVLSDEQPAKDSQSSWDVEDDYDDWRR